MLPCHAYPKLKEYPSFKRQLWYCMAESAKNLKISPVLFYLQPIVLCLSKKAMQTVSLPLRCCLSGNGSHRAEKILLLSLKKHWNWVAIKETQHMTQVSTEGTTVTTGFGWNTVLSVADKVIDAVKDVVAIQHFFLVGGCDGARTGRNYYTEFVESAKRHYDS